MKEVSQIKHRTTRGRKWEKFSCKIIKQTKIHNCSGHKLYPHQAIWSQSIKVRCVKLMASYSISQIFREISQSLFDKLDNHLKRYWWPNGHRWESQPEKAFQSADDTLDFREYGLISQTAHFIRLKTFLWKTQFEIICVRNWVDFRAV